jgi:dUTP pyrophosphatase
MEKILFAKVKPNAIIPSKREEDGCFDIHACFDEDEIVIFPNEIKLIPTGIASVFDKKYRVAIRERGTNTKSGLAVRAGQIDSGFRGEWVCALQNTRKTTVIIRKGVDDFIKINGETIVPYSKAIAQFAIEEVPQVDICEIQYEDLMNYKSERMCGMLGSSGK